MAESPSRLAKSASAAWAPRERARAVVATPASGELGAALGSLAAGGGNRAVSGLLTGGTPLPPQVLADMESRFGQSFSDVRIHDDAQAHASAARMHAKAYTHGYDIVFSANRFAPHAGPGKRLLAHELAHVVQQRRGGSAPASDSLGEHEVSARQAADGVMQGNAPIAVQGSTGIGVAREAEDGGVRGFMLERAKRALADALIGSIGLPPAGTRLAAAVARGMGEQMAHELISDGKGAILLGHVAAMGPADVAQLVKGYYVGLVEGLVSPVTDLFGLAVFGERMEGMAEDLALSAFGARSELVTDLRSLLGEAATVKKSLRKVWGKVKEDPVAALNTLLSLPDAIGDLAEKKAYQLGKQGGSSIVASIGAPWSKDKKEEEPKPSLVTSPFAWVESKAKSAEDWVLDTPWSQIGSKAGYAIGFVAIQVVLFAFTEGIGNAIEEVGVALGKVGNALGRLSKLVGTAAGRVAELVTAVGKGIAFVEEAIALLAGKALKPLEKFLEPILEPLGNFFKSLRTFLRRLFGVAEKEGTQIVDAAAGKAGSLADDSARLGSKAGSPPGKPPEAHAPSAKPKSHVAGATDEEKLGSTVAKDQRRPGQTSADRKPPARSGGKPASASGEADQAGKPPAPTQSQPPPKKGPGTSRGAGKKKATGGGKSESATPAGDARTAARPAAVKKGTAPRGTSPAKKSPRIKDPHGMRPDATNFDRQTAGAGGIDEIGFLKDPDGRYAVKIKGKLQEGLYRGKGKAPPNKIKAPNYNRSGKFVSNKEAGLTADWENAHLWGPGFGDEAAAGMMKAPRSVNQWYQNEGIEGWARDLRKAADELPKVAGKGAEVELEATAIAWDLHGNAWQPKTQVDFLKRAEYRVKLTTPTGEAASVRVTIDVAPPPGTKVVISFDPPNVTNPADLLKIVKGTKTK